MILVNILLLGYGFREAKIIRIRIHITVAWRDLIQPFETFIVPHLTYILKMLGIRNQICLEKLFTEIFKVLDLD